MSSLIASLQPFLSRAPIVIAKKVHTKIHGLHFLLDYRLNFRRLRVGQPVLIYNDCADPFRPGTASPAVMGTIIGASISIRDPDYVILHVSGDDDIMAKLRVPWRMTDVPCLNATRGASCNGDHDCRMGRPSLDDCIVGMIPYPSRTLFTTHLVDMQNTLQLQRPMESSQSLEIMLVTAQRNVSRRRSLVSLPCFESYTHY